MSAAMFGELLDGVLLLCCLVFGCAMVRLLCMPFRRPWLRRSRLRRLAWRRKLPKRLSQREQREWMRLCWVLEHVDSYDPDAVAADDTEGEL